MDSTITFNSFVETKDCNGKISNSELTDKDTRKKVGTPAIKPKSLKAYTQEKAETVGIRIEKEVNDKTLLSKRINEEYLVEKLLVRRNLVTKVNKIYRLSDTTLYILKKKLL